MWSTDKSIPLVARKSFRDAEPKFKEHLSSLEKVLGYAVVYEIDVPAFVAENSATPAAKKEDLGKWLWDIYPQTLFKAIGDFVTNGPEEAKRFETNISAKTVVVRPGATGGSLHKLVVENGKLICLVEPANLGFELVKIDDLVIDASLTGGSAALSTALPKDRAPEPETKKDRPVREPPPVGGANASNGDVSDQLKHLQLLELQSRIVDDQLSFDGEALALVAKGPSLYSQLKQLSAAATPGNLLLARVSSLLRALAKENLRQTPTIHAQAATLYGMDPSVNELQDARKISKYLYVRRLRESTPQNPQSFWQAFVPETVFSALRGGAITSEMDQLGFRIKIQAPFRKDPRDHEMIPFTLSW